MEMSLKMGRELLPSGRVVRPRHSRAGGTRESPMEEPPSLQRGAWADRRRRQFSDEDRGKYQTRSWPV